MINNKIFTDFVYSLKNKSNINIIESIINKYNSLFENSNETMYEVPLLKGKGRLKTKIPPEKRTFKNIPKYSTGKNRVKFQDWLELYDFVTNKNVAKSPNGKWYGWSHRAVYGFGIGDKIKKGDSGYEYLNKEYTIKTDDQAKEAAINFADSVS